MLQHISTATFIEGLVLITVIYYAIVAGIFYAKKIANRLQRRIKDGDDILEDDQLFEDKV